MLLAVACGLAWGAFCAWGDLQGLGFIGGVANTGGPWLLLAFVVGMRTRGLASGVAAGALVLVVSVAAYYIAHDFGEQNAGRNGALGRDAWLPVAVVGGALLGGAGRVSQGAYSGWVRVAAVAIAGGALVAEALLILNDEGSLNSGLRLFLFMELLLGLAMPFVLLRSARERIAGVVLLTAAASAGYVIEQMILNAVADSLSG